MVLVLVVVGAALLVLLLVGRIWWVVVPVGVSVVVVVVRESDGCGRRRHLAGYEPSGRGEELQSSRSISSFAIESIVGGGEAARRRRVSKDGG
jgi:hypothetical protein